MAAKVETQQPSATFCRSERAAGGSLDWPLSKNEKAGHVIRLYEREKKAADDLLMSGERAADVLRQEIQELKRSSIASSTDSESSGQTVSRDCSKKASPAVDSGAADEAGGKIKELVTPVTTSSDPGNAAAPESQCTVDSSRSHDGNKSPRIASSPALAVPKSKALLKVDSGTNLAAARLQRAIAEATETLSALLGAAALEQEDDLHASWEENSCAGQLPRARSEPNRVLMPAGGLATGRRRRLSRGGQPLRVSFAEESARGPEGGDADSEPEPSPEAPSTPERSPQPPQREVHRLAPSPGWQRSTALSGGRRAAYGRLEFDGDPRSPDVDECSRGRRRDRREYRDRPLAINCKPKSPRSKAPSTTMDFL